MARLTDENGELKQLAAKAQEHERTIAQLVEQLQLATAPGARGTAPAAAATSAPGSSWSTSGQLTSLLALLPRPAPSPPSLTLHPRPPRSPCLLALHTRPPPSPSPLALILSRRQQCAPPRRCNGVGVRVGGRGGG